jgi:hypothetical protein
MARWRLTASHYLNLKPGIEWQQVETDRDTGVQARTTYMVPKLLDLNDPRCYNGGRDIVVCDGTNPQRGDHIFIGNPTPDMEPMDDEAEKITASFRSNWVHPIESLPANGDYSAGLISEFTKQIDTLVRLGRAEPANPVSAESVSKADFAALQEQVGALMARNAELEATKAEPKAARR